MFVCLSVFVCVCVCLTSSACSSVSRCVSTSLSPFPSLSLSLSPSASLAVCSSVSLSVCLSVSVFLSRSLYMSFYVCLSVCLYVCLSVCLRARACCSGTSFERPGQQRGPRAQPGSQKFPESAGGEAERVDRQESSEGGSRGVRRIGEVHAWQRGAEAEGEAMPLRLARTQPRLKQRGERPAHLPDPGL